MFMSSTIISKKIKSRMRFSPDFKQKVAQEVLSSSDSYAEIGIKFGVTTHQVARWFREYHNPATRWVKALAWQNTITGKHGENKELVLTSPIIESQPVMQNANYLPNEQAFHDMELYFPSGAKLSMQNMTPDLLKIILEAFKNSI